ncbi:GrpB family protein [Bacillus pacificus]
MAFFRKGKWRAGTHHLHVYIYNSDEWKNNLLFRDFLIKHEWARKEYRELKERLAATYPFDRGFIYKCKSAVYSKNNKGS